MKFLITSVLILCSFFAFGQVTISEEMKISQLMERYEALGKEESFIDGWRIKLISTTNRRQLESAKYRFQQRYPGLFYSLSHENPYYSLKVGAFETRFDVEPFLVKFKEDFANAIPFRDKIMKSELFDD